MGGAGGATDGASWLPVILGGRTDAKKVSVRSLRSGGVGGDVVSFWRDGEGRWEGVKEDEEVFEKEGLELVFLFCFFLKEVAMLTLLVGRGSGSVSLSGMSSKLTSVFSLLDRNLSIICVALILEGLSAVYPGSSVAFHPDLASSSSLSSVRPVSFALAGPFGDCTLSSNQQYYS